MVELQALKGCLEQLTLDCAHSSELLKWQFKNMSLCFSSLFSYSQTILYIIVLMQIKDFVRCIAIKRSFLWRSHSQDENIFRLQKKGYKILSVWESWDIYIQWAIKRVRRRGLSLTSERAALSEMVGQWSMALIKGCVPITRIWHHQLYGVSTMRM